MLEKLKAVHSRYEELCVRSEQADFYADPKKAAAFLREKNDLEPIVEAYLAYLGSLRDMEDAQELMSDPEMKEFCQESYREAKEKSEEQGNDILYICQDAASLDLHGKVDGAVCLLDSLNHIIDYTEFCKAIERVSLFLCDEGLFIFDVNTIYKHRQVLGDNTFVLEEEGVYCVWQNFYNPEDNTVDIALDFFEGDGKNYKRYSEDITERAYTEKEIKSALKKAGLEILAVYDDMTYNSLKKDSERAIYITRKIK